MNRFRRFQHLHRAQRSPIDLGKVVIQSPTAEVRGAAWWRGGVAVAAMLVVGLGVVAIVLVSMQLPTGELAIDTPPPSPPAPEIHSDPADGATGDGGASASVPAPAPAPAPSDEPDSGTGDVARPWESRPLMPARPVRSRSYSLTPPPPAPAAPSVRRGGWSLPGRRFPDRTTR